ncbi:amidohydrolase family protein [Blastomonas sp.]|uniref:amidohydrolase family protein n=1 Tax=Blastomonas sp. TaxID=1909299 RepID=UPI0035943CB8
MVMRLILWLLGLIVLSACTAVPELSKGAAGGAAAPIAIVGVTVIPMTEESALLPNYTVVIRDGKIAAVGPRGKLAIPAGAVIIDGTGRFLMPGLTDAHVHLEYIENPDILKLFVANGVTTIRSMDGRPFILGWRERTSSGDLIGPRIITAGPIIDGSPPARDDNLAAADATASRAAVAAQKQQGYDFIKAYSNLSSETYDELIREAELRGLKVAGHIPRAVPLDRAIAAQWSIEHLGDFAAVVTAEDESPVPGWARRSLAAPLSSSRLQALARQLATAGVWVVPTSVQQDRSLAPDIELKAWLVDPQMRNIPSFALEQWKGATSWWQRLDAGDWALVGQARKNRLMMISEFREAGVRMAIGSDTPNPFVIPGASVHLELANFVAAGFSPAESLAAATIEPARMLDLDQVQGSVEAGKRADLLLLYANPLDDIANAAARVGIFLSGRWFSEQELQSMAQDLARATPTTQRVQ